MYLLIVLNEIKCIYLNWIENTLDELDRQLLKKAKKMRVKIIWVFHNRLPHDTKSEQQDIDNIFQTAYTNASIAII